MGKETWPPIGWHHHFVTGGCNYRLKLPRVPLHDGLSWRVGIPTVFRLQWQMPAVRAVQGTVKESSLSGIPRGVHMLRNHESRTWVTRKYSNATLHGFMSSVYTFMVSSYFLIMSTCLFDYFLVDILTHCGLVLDAFASITTWLSAKPSFEPLLSRHQWNLYKETALRIGAKFRHFQSGKLLWKYCLQH